MERNKFTTINNRTWYKQIIQLDEVDINVYLVHDDTEFGIKTYIYIYIQKNENLPKSVLLYCVLTIIYVYTYIYIDITKDKQKKTDTKIGVYMIKLSNDNRLLQNRIRL